MSVTGSSRGFTLMELLVVLLILVLATVALPYAMSSRRLETRRLAIATQRVTNAIVESQALAATLGQPIVLRRTTEGLTFEMPMSNPSVPTREIYAIDAPVAIEWSTQHGQLTFFPDGSASGGTLVVGSGVASRKLVISPLTGRVRTLAHP